MLILRLDHEAETYAILKPEVALDELIFNECTQFNKINALGFGQVELNESLMFEFYPSENESVVRYFFDRIEKIKRTGYIDISDLFEG